MDGWTNGQTVGTGHQETTPLKTENQVSSFRKSLLLQNPQNSGPGVLVVGPVVLVDGPGVLVVGMRPAVVVFTSTDGSGHFAHQPIP